MTDKNKTDEQTAAREASLSAPICSALKWMPGPAEDGGGTAGKDEAGNDMWWDGDMFIAVVELRDGSRDIFLASVSCDEEMFDLRHPLTGDSISEWGTDSISWWAKIDEYNLPPNTVVK